MPENREARYRIYRIVDSDHLELVLSPYCYVRPGESDDEAIEAAATAELATMPAGYYAVYPYYVCREFTVSAPKVERYRWRFGSSKRVRLADIREVERVDG